MALRPLRFRTGGGPLGTPSVTVSDRRGPPWHSVRYGFGPEGAPWHSVRYGFGPEGAPLALRPLRFWTGGGPLGTPSVTVLDRRGPLGTLSVTVLDRRGPSWLALFDISISNIDCRYIDTFQKYRYRYGHF